MVCRADSAAASAAAILLIGAIASRSDHDRSNTSPVYGVRLPPDYRQWPVISAAHEAGKLNDIRVVLGNAPAIKAYRSGTRPFPDGAVLVRIAWKLVPSARNDAIFGQPQSFVAGEPTTVQIEVKDSKKYPDTRGWGYAQFDNGKANKDVALIRTCFACHAKLPAAEDFIFTPYSR